MMNMSVDKSEKITYNKRKNIGGVKNADTF